MMRRRDCRTSRGKDMTPDQIKHAADLLIDARLAGTQMETWPTECRPESTADAYAIQDTIARRFGPVSGWKISLPAGDSDPIVAPLFKSLMFESPAALPASRFHMIGIEVEIAFRIGRDLSRTDPKYSPSDIVSAMQTMIASIEVVDTRFKNRENIDKMSLLADNQSNGAFVSGSGLADWRDINLSRQTARLWVDGNIVAETVGRSADVDTVVLLTWLANHCVTRCGGLRAGDIVTTGSWTGIVLVSPGAEIFAEFPGIGEIEIQIIEDQPS